MKNFFNFSVLTEVALTKCNYHYHLRRTFAKWRLLAKSFVPHFQHQWISYFTVKHQNQTLSKILGLHIWVLIPGIILTRAKTKILLLKAPKILQNPHKKRKKKKKTWQNSMLHYICIYVLYVWLYSEDRNAFAKKFALKLYPDSWEHIPKYSVTKVSK